MRAENGSWYDEGCWKSGLTLTELHVIEETLCKGLIALYHSRIKYPEPAERERCERKAS